MKIAVFSDTHGESAFMEVLAERHRPDYVVHLGDCVRDVEALRRACPALPMAYVVGNNDFFAKQTPEQQVIELGGVRLLLTHGHRQNVKRERETLCRAGREAAADIVLFGHTHEAENRRTDGLRGNFAGGNYPGAAHEGLMADKRCRPWSDGFQADAQRRNVWEMNGNEICDGFA